MDSFLVKPACIKTLANIHILTITSPSLGCLLYGFLSYEWASIILFMIQYIFLVETIW